MTRPITKLPPTTKPPKVSMIWLARPADRIRRGRRHVQRQTEQRRDQQQRREHRRTGAARAPCIEVSRITTASGDVQRQQEVDERRRQRHHHHHDDRDDRERDADRGEPRTCLGDRVGGAQRHAPPGRSDGPRRSETHGHPELVGEGPRRHVRRRVAGSLCDRDRTSVAPAASVSARPRVLASCRPSCETSEVPRRSPTPIGVDAVSRAAIGPD